MEDDGDASCAAGDETGRNDEEIVAGGHDEDANGKHEIGFHFIDFANSKQGGHR